MHFVTYGTFFFCILLPLGGLSGLGDGLLPRQGEGGGRELGHHHVLHPLCGQAPDGVDQQLCVLSGQLLQEGLSRTPAQGNSNK